MKNSTIIASILFIVVLVGGFIFLKGGSGNIDGNVVGSGGAQEITLGVKNLNYYPNTIKVNVNQPVRIYLDKSVTGCLRSFTIRDFGVSKNAKTPSDTIDFTPTKKGTFRFACSMGMGYGSIIVE